MSTEIGVKSRGLTSADAKRLLERHGPNALPPGKSASFWHRLLRQFQSPLIYILLFALAADLAIWWHEGRSEFPVEPLVIGLILLLNAGLGVWQESKAEAALAKLKALSSPHVTALRDGEWKQISATELVPGDLVRIEAGDRVPADGRVTGTSIAVDESNLTGESVPIDKKDADDVFSGTLVVRGLGEIEVTRTGEESALGKLAGMLTGIQADPTPLEKRLKVFGNRIAKWVLVIAAVIVLQGLLTEGLGGLGHSFVLAVALAVAVVPEGLPAILTLTLSLGVERMASRKAVVRRLSAVEALGSVTVIATDKTGTLTENRMEVKAIDGPDREAAIWAAVFANDAEGEAGDPMDVALLKYAETQGSNPTELKGQHRRSASRPFDSELKYMRVTVQNGSNTVSYLKGAPEVIMERSEVSDEERHKWLGEAQSSAEEGFRVLGLASGNGETEENLRFLGLAQFWDPPRPEVGPAIDEAQKAGIRVLMITGDHAATALAIARKVGIESERALTGQELEAEKERDHLENVNVFARVRPEHKLSLVETLQKDGEVVAMTGDGVNDAPALKRSDVGIAMGQRGSDVSREVADLVLLDDNFATIVAAIEEGRSIYENIQKFIRFLFSTNLAELVLIAGGVALAAILGLRDSSGAHLIPLTAAQILWINLVTDGIPALALALDRNPQAMSLPPRPPSSPLLDRLSLRFILMAGLLNGGLALGILGLAQVGWITTEVARTIAFHFVAIVQLFFVYPARHTTLKPLPSQILHLAVAAGVLLQIAAGTIPVFTKLLNLESLTITAWGGVFVAALCSWGIAEAANRLIWRRT